MMMKILKLSSVKTNKRTSLLRLPFFFMLLLSMTAFSQNSVDFFIFPASPAVTVNQTFTVEVRVRVNSGSLDAAEVHLDFNPAYLEVLSITTPASDSLPLTAIPIAPLATINTTGQIDYAAGTSSNFFTSDFILMTITFRAEAMPPGATTPLNFSLTFPRQTDATRNGESILATTTGAVITITGTLPVSLTSFTAKAQSKDVVLNWTTAFETNSRGFEVQRSLDGIKWIPIGFVNSKGVSNAARQYSFTDNDLSPRRYTYRLKQEDLNAQFKYSAIVAATIFGDKLFILEQNQPNPYSANTAIKFSLAERKKVRLVVVDMQGKVLRTILDETKEAGTHVVNFSAQSLTSGVYYYKLDASGFTDTKKMVIR